MAEDKKAKKEDKPKDDKAPEADTEKAEGAENAEGAEGAGSGRGFSRKKILLFVVLPLALIIALGSGAYFTGLLDKFLPGHKTPCEEVKEGDADFEKCQAEKEAAEALTPGVFLDVPNLIVNLNSTGKQSRFLKVSLKIEVENEVEKTKFEPVLPRVIDQFQMYLRELRIEDLRGTSGIYRMKIELLSRVRAVAPGTKVRDVLFQEILVQ